MHRGTDKVGELEAALVGGGAWTSSRGARIAHARAAVTAVHRHAAMRLTLTMDTHVLQYCWRLRARSEARGGSASHPAGDERRVTAAGEAKRRGRAPRPPVEAPPGTERAACCLGPRPLPPGRCAEAGSRVVPPRRGVGSGAQSALVVWPLP